MHNPSTDTNLTATQLSDLQVSNLCSSPWPSQPLYNGTQIGWIQLSLPFWKEWGIYVLTNDDILLDSNGKESCWTRGASPLVKLLFSQGISLSIWLLEPGCASGRFYVSIFLSGPIWSRHGRICAPKRQQNADTNLGVKGCFRRQRQTTTGSSRKTCSIFDNIILSKVQHAVCPRSVPREGNHTEYSVCSQVSSLSCLLFAGLCGRPISASQFEVNYLEVRFMMEGLTITPHLHKGMPCDLRYSFLPEWFQAQPLDLLWPRQYEQK